MWAQLLLFAGVGVGNVLVDAVVFALLVEGLGWRTPSLAAVASLAGFSAGAVHSFAWNSTVTFTRRGSLAGTIERFVIATVFGALCSALVVAMIVRVAPDGRASLVLAKAVATAGGMIVNFTLLRSWVFPSHVAEASSNRSPLGLLRRRSDGASRTPVGEARPWGRFDILETREHYQVKRLEILPERRLSYQTHRFRSEHWLVVSGRGVAVLDGAVIEVVSGISVDVAIGVAHRIENNGEGPLVIVEVQRGSYLGEDDIVRLDDDYGRAEAAA